MKATNAAEELTQIAKHSISQITLLMNACNDFATGNGNTQQLDGINNTIEQLMQYIKSQRKNPVFLSEGLSISTMDEKTVTRIRFTLQDLSGKSVETAEESDMAEKYNQLLTSFEENLRLKTKYEREMEFAVADFKKNFHETVGTNWNRKYTENDQLWSDCLSVLSAPLFLAAKGCLSVAINMLRLAFNTTIGPLFYKQEDLRIQLSTLKIGMAFTMIGAAVISPLARIINIYGRCTANEEIIEQSEQLREILSKFEADDLGMQLDDIFSPNEVVSGTNAYQVRLKNIKVQEKNKDIADDNALSEQISQGPLSSKHQG